MADPKNKKKGMSFKLLCLCFGLIPLLVTTIAVASLSIYMLNKNIKNGLYDALKVAAEGVEEYFAYDIAANGAVDYDEYSDHEYVQSQQPNDIELTLFQGDIRFLTSLKNTDGSYNEGTQANADIYAAVKGGSDYQAEGVAINGTDYMVYYTPIYDGNGNFWGMAFAGEPQAKVSDSVGSVTRNMILIAVAMIIVFSLAIWFLTTAFEKPIKRVAESLGILSGGDLDADFEFTSAVIEFGELIDAGGVLQSQLSNIIGNAKTTAVDLGASVTNVDGLSQSSADGTSQISLAVDELATTAQSMAETVQDANSAMIDMGNIIDDINEGVATMVQVSNESYEANMKAVKAMDVLQDASNKSADSIDAIRTQINDTNKAIDEVRTAADTISAISEETNLLALNASIEAARAGEAGRGFAVVAENIKKLAEESNQNAVQIQQIINQIIELSEKSVEMAGSVGEIVEDQKAALEDAYKEMEATKESGIKMSEGVKQVGEQADTLTSLKESVLGNITDLSAISEENAASSEEVLASVSNIAEAIGNTKNESAAMKELADALSERMAFFK